MPVFLTKNADSQIKYDRKLDISSTDMAEDEASLKLNTSALLETAFNEIYGTWKKIALSLQKQPGAQLAHMPTMSTYASDFGIMLAWQRIIETLIDEPEITLVQCCDPWLFRSLACLPNIQTSEPPSLLRKSLPLWVRGYLARVKLVARLTLAKLKTRQMPRLTQKGGPWILVYGHPDSNAQGGDAYFGDLLKQLPNLRRAMHTDCSASLALNLATDKKTISLHGWGSFLSLLQIPWQKWRPAMSLIDQKYRWLVKRAAAIEGSGGSAAMTTWQQTCHQSWLQDVQPKTVCWPWENHPWERDFVRHSRGLNVRTLGYQHTVVGRHMFNQGADANADGLQSIPDKILLNGPCYHDDLASRSIPTNRMEILGSHRIGQGQLPTYETSGVVFLALSNNPSFARQMMDATLPFASRDLQFIVKAHPLNPYPIEESDYFTSTRDTLDALPPIRALIYCTGTTGLQGLLAGIPTLRFIPKDGVALDILPESMQVTSVSETDIGAALKDLPEPYHLDVEALFPPPNLKKWHSTLEPTKP